MLLMAHAERRKACLGIVVTILVTLPVAADQQQPSGLKSGNPTPGTEQPVSPNPAERIGLTGCVELVSQSGRASATVDPNAPTDARFLLTKPQRVLQPGAAAATSVRAYRLKGIGSQLLPFVGMKVYVSGQVEGTSPGASDRSSSSPSPVLQVEFIRKTATTCS
jgi:hypothetical protein